MAMTVDVDWEQLARQLGSIRENTALGPYSESGGSDIARQALVALLGDEFWRQAVDSYVYGVRGGEVISSIMRLIKPRPAMERCYELHKSDADEETRSYALVLLVDAADYSVLPWVSEFLSDHDEQVGIIGTWILERLLYVFAEDPPAEFESLLAQAEAHPSQRVREQLEQFDLRERLKSRGLLE